MNNSFNSVNTGSQTLDLSNKSESELKAELLELVQQEPMDENLIVEYKKALKVLKEKNLSFENIDTNFTKQNKITRQSIYDRASEDIKKYKSELSDKDKKIMSQNDSIEDLMAKLNKSEEEKAALLTGPGLWEYLSLKSRRTAKLLTQISKLKSDPKKLLIFAMWVVSSKRLWLGQWTRRLMVRATWKRRNEDIKDNIENLLNICKIDEQKDSPWQKAIKKWIIDAVREAKDAYLNSIQRQNTF